MGKELYRFGDFTADPVKRRLSRHDTPVPLSSKAFDLLLILIAAPGQRLSRGGLIEKVWPETEAGERNLNQCIAVLRKALGDDPKQPEFIATLPGHGYSFIADVIIVGDGPSSAPSGIEPAHAQSIADSPPSSGAGEAAAEQNSRPLRRVFTYAAGLLLAIAATASVYLMARGHRATRRGVNAANPVIPARRAVAVLGFENLSHRPQDAWLSTALSEMLSTEIGAGGKLRIVPGESVARARNDLKIASLDGLSNSTVAQVRKDLSVNWIVTGAYTVEGHSRAENRQIRLDLRVQNAKSGKIVATGAATGSLNHLFRLVARAGSQLRGDLGLEPLSAADAQQADAALPSSLEAAQLYAEGLAKLRAFDALGARDLLQRAVAADPSFPLAYLALARVYGGLHQQNLEIQNARKAVALSAHLSREQQLWIEARLDQAEQNWKKEKPVDQALVLFYPDNIDYGLQLAEVEGASGNLTGALATLERLRKLPPPLSTDPRIDFTEARIRGAQSEFRLGLIPADRALAEAKARGARWLYAQALLVKAGLLASLTDYAASAPIDKKARQICAQLGDFACVAATYRRIGYMKIDSDPKAAEQALRNALQIARKIGDTVEAGAELNGLAAIFSDQGRYSEADQIYRSLLQQARAQQNPFGIQMFLDNLGNDQIHEAKLSAAKQMEQEALDVSRQSGQKIGIADELVDLGRIADLQGDLIGAAKDYRQAIAVFNQITEKGGVSVALAGLASVSRERGDFAAASSEYKQAITLLVPGTDDGTIAETRLGLARLYIEQGRASKAANMAQQALQTFHTQNRIEGVLRARAVLARALFSAGKFSDAVAQLNQENVTALGTEARLTRLTIGVDRASVMSEIDQQERSPRLPRELQRLNTVASEAESSGLTVLALDARLAEDSIEAESGSRMASLRLGGIEHRAESLGLYGLVRVARQETASEAPIAGLSRFRPPNH